MVDQLIQAYQGLILPMTGWIIFWFALSIVLKRNDLVDIAWGLGFIYIIIWETTNFELNIQTFVNVLIILWGLRLAIYLLIRNAKKKEDWRYLNWRKEWGKTFYIRSFFQIYVLQTVLMLLIAAPIVLAPTIDSSITYYMIPGAIVWCIGFYWESLGDWQLMQFKRNPANAGQFIQSGLWSKSRHPNYFGEICMWWGIWLLFGEFSIRWLALISPIVITYLLLKVSGVPMLERKYKGNKAFDHYKSRVPGIWPKLK